MRAAILLAGPLAVGPGLKAALKKAELVIAADGGIRHAEALGRAPDLWVGDFDSTPLDLLRHYAHLPSERHPRDKDATDGELAVQAALKRSARALLLAGALGGEPDHALAHQLLALKLAEEGFKAMLTDGAAWAWPVVPPGITLKLPPGSRFSLVPLDALEDLALQGARWALEGAHIPPGSTRTLRNQAKGPVVIRLKKGRAMVFAWPADSSFLPW